MKQQIFKFGKNKNSFKQEDFVLSLCNFEAYKYITEDISWPLGRLIIIGEEGSGKTHLAKIWQERSNAVFINSFQTLLEASGKNDKFILDNLDTIPESELFDIINHCQNNSFELLITTDNIKPNYELNDLKSRINASKILIRQPDLETFKILTFKYFSLIQLKINNEVIDYISNRAERSYSFLKSLINEIDLLSLEEKRNITIPLVKKVIETNFNQYLNSTENNEPAKKEINTKIADKGYIPIDEFFEISNNYYYDNLISIGKKGDFITSPEISQLFGETIAFSLYHKWQKLGCKKFNLIELGPGNGTLTSDILRTFKKLPDIMNFLEKIILVEKSSSLQKKQMYLLRDYNKKIIWLNNLDNFNETNCLLICNEFFDALPFKQYQFLQNRLQEVVINENYNFDLIESDFQRQLNEGDIIEHSNQSMIYAKIINKITSKGAAIIIDYGYWDSPKISTLQAMKNNMKIEVFDFIGESDLTYHVNFQDLAYSFEGRSIHFSTQSEFLNINGIQAIAAKIIKNTPSLINDINTEVLRLTSQENMGSLFKVLEII